MRTVGRGRLVFVLAALALGAASCGGAGIDAPRSPERPTAEIDVVNDGLGEDAVFQRETDRLSANWSASGDGLPWLSSYWCAVGTAPGEADVVDWTNNGLETKVTVGDLSLTDGATYYVSVYLIGIDGSKGPVVSSDGVTVDAGAPTAIAWVNDGASADEDVQGTLFELSANWGGSESPSGVTYWYAFGTAPGATDVLDFTSAGTPTSASETWLPDVTDGETFYASVYAENALGARSSVATSDGTAVDLPEPTNTRIVFSSERDSDWLGEDASPYFQTYIMDLDGSNMTRIGFSGEDERWPIITPDGSLIAFDSWGGGYISIVDADGNEVRRFDYGAQPSFSPDGKRMLVISNHDDPNCYTYRPDFCPGDIFVMNIDLTNPRRITNNINSEQNPRFSPDGKYITFTCDAEDDNLSSASAVCMVKPDGSDWRVLVDDNVRDPSFSPDGKRIVYQKVVDGDFDLYLLDLDTMEETRVTYSPDLWEGGPCFDYSGRYLVYSGVAAGEFNNIKRLDLETGEIIKLTDFEGGELYPRIMP